MKLWEEGGVWGQKVSVQERVGMRMHVASEKGKATRTQGTQQRTGCSRPRLPSSQGS